MYNKQCVSSNNGMKIDLNRPSDRVQLKTEIVQNFQGRLCDKEGLLF